MFGDRGAVFPKMRLDIESLGTPGALAARADEVRHRGIADSGPNRQCQHIFLGHFFADVAEQQDDGVVRHDQYPLAGIQAIQVAQHGTEPEGDVSPRFASRWPVVELAEPPASVRFKWKPSLDSSS